MNNEVYSKRVVASLAGLTTTSENVTFIISIVSLSNKNLRKLDMKDSFLETEKLSIYDPRTKWLLYSPELPEHHAVVDLGSSHDGTTLNAFFGCIEIIDIDSRAKGSENKYAGLLG